MEILQVCHVAYGQVGGVSFHVRSISERLARKHNVTVFANNTKMRFPRIRIENGVRVESFKCYSPGDAYAFSWEMLLRMHNAKFDVVHGHGYHAFPLHLSATVDCSRFIVTTHFHGFGHSPFRDSLIRLLKPFGRQTLKKANKIVAVSEYERLLLRRYFGFDSDRISLIPNGVDFKEFSGLRRQDNGYKSVLYVGYLASYKGVQYLVEVMRKLADNVILEIVGNGPLKPFLERRVRELQIADRVKFYQNLPRTELLQKYADASVMAILSRYEAYSIVVAEALMAGTPCVVANTSALSEWIDDESCYGVNLPVDLDKLGRTITTAIDTRVSNFSRRKWMAGKIFDWNHVSELLEAAYSE